MSNYGLVEYRGTQYHVDQDGRVIEQSFVDVKKQEYQDAMTAFSKLWEGSGLLPPAISKSISLMQGAIGQNRANVESELGIKTNDHKFAGGLHNRDDMRIDEGLES